MLPKSATDSCNCDFGRFGQLGNVDADIGCGVGDQRALAARAAEHADARPPRYFLTKPSQEKTLTLSISSLMLRTETMPPWRNAASTTSAAPASEPEWVAAARFDTSERPPLRIISGLFAAAALRATGEQVFRLLEAFDEDRDDACVFVFDEIVHVLFEVAPD